MVIPKRGVPSVQEEQPCPNGTLLLLDTLFTLYIASTSGQAATKPDQMHLFLNALVGEEGTSTVQCWAVDPPFTISKQPGTVGAKIQSIGDTSGSTIVFFNETASTNAGLHPAPAPQ